MEAFVFPSQEALQVALSAGLVPPEVQRAPVHFVRLADGSVQLAPSVGMAESARRALAAAGVEARAPGAEPTSAASCWAEALPPVRVGEPRGTLPVVLFALQSGTGLLEVAGELLRLGCDRQELGLGAGGALLKVEDPPWYVVSRALDHLDGLTAFAPSPAGQDLVWTELGFSHPLDARLEQHPDQLLLVTGTGRWRQLPVPAWRDLDELLVPVGLPTRSPQAVEGAPPRLEVQLSLHRSSRAEPASLFVVPRGLQAVEALVRSTPEAQLDHLLFLVTGTTVVLRARPGREANTGGLPGERHARLLDLPNLYAPEGTTVEPPLRRDRLRSWLAPDPDQVTWLEPTPGGFARRSVPEAAFRPLGEWVDYVVDGAAEVLEAWARSARFDLQPFAVGEEPAAPAPVERPAPEDEPRPRPRRPVESRAPAPRDALPPAEPARADRTAPVIEAPRSPTEAEAMLAREEAAFLELDAPADSRPRRQAWERLAEMYARLQRSRDAGMAWAQAVWDAPEDELPRLARRWAETAQAGTPEVAARVAEWSAFLDRFSDDLDVRSFWLGRHAVSRLAGGDALGLARARDRVLARLQGGLSVDRDVPRLLRVMGQVGAAGAGTDRAVRVAAQLEALLQAFDETPRKRSPVEAAPALTRAYVHLEFAWAFARLAAPERARQLRDGALQGLDRADPVHHYLTRAYQARIEQAIEGAAPDTPLPPEVNGLLNGLESFHRYQVDRLRQFSQVLEPQERLDAYDGFWRTSSPRGEELSALRGVKDSAELRRAIHARMGAAADLHLPPEERVRLIDGLMDFLPQLPESQALPLLQDFLRLGDALEPPQRVVILEDGLKVAGHFGRTALVKQLVLQLGNLIRELGAEGVGQVGAMLLAGVRSMRRVGLREEARELLARASTVLRSEDVGTLQARLALASGFAYLGVVDQAQPIIDEAQVRLRRESGLNIGDRSKLTRALAQTLSHASTEVALPGLLRLAQQLPWTTDGYNTNTHFCLSVVELADALVLGHVGDDLTLNETTRRYLDEDEYLVRRRVHRDVGGPS